MLTFVGTFVVGGAILEESYLNQGGVGVTGGLVEGNLSQSCRKDKTPTSSLLFPNVYVKQIFFYEKVKECCELRSVVLVPSAAIDRLNVLFKGFPNASENGPWRLHFQRCTQQKVITRWAGDVRESLGGIKSDHLVIRYSLLSLFKHICDKKNRTKACMH